MRYVEELLEQAKFFIKVRWDGLLSESISKAEGENDRRE
jgi:hypothetical protein